MNFETRMSSAHYMVHAIGSASLSFCFIYFGRKVKGFAEASIALLMDTDMDSSKYENAFDLSFIQVSPSQRHFSFGIWSVSGDSNNQQLDKNDSVLLPPPPSYNDNEQETSRKSPMKRNYRYSLSSSSVNRNSILPEIVVSTPDVASAKKTTKNGEKSDFVTAWILDQHERTT
ncbi:3125_t:CDS:2, partial [Racocetra fulgida]